VDVLVPVRDDRIMCCTYISTTCTSTTDDAPDGEDGQIVSLSRKGQATIPKELREKHSIEPGGKVRIKTNEAGEIVVEPVPALQEFRGAATSERSGTSILEDERERDADRARRLERD
jgi:AbrB family looped-hinge helix DNA binding protein